MFIFLQRIIIIGINQAPMHIAIDMGIHSHELILYFIQRVVPVIILPTACYFLPGNIIPMCVTKVGSKARFKPKNELSYLLRAALSIAVGFLYGLVVEFCKMPGDSRCSSYLL